MAEELIVITGVTQGLGLQMSKWFVSNGHKVLGCGRSTNKIEQLNHQYSRAKFSAVDITRDDEVEKWAQESLAEFGPPTFLLNNAGLINDNANLWEVPRGNFENVIDVNIKGTVNVIRHFVPDMVKVKRGVIVNFSSRWGRSATPHIAPYCATKWAIEGMSKALALELPKPMVCVPLNPGIINTPMLQTSHGKEGAALYENAEDWAERACSYILKIGREQNGCSVVVPQ